MGFRTISNFQSLISQSQLGSVVQIPDLWVLVSLSASKARCGCEIVFVTFARAAQEVPEEPQPCSNFCLSLPSAQSSQIRPQACLPWQKIQNFSAVKAFSFRKAAGVFYPQSSPQCWTLRRISTPNLREHWNKKLLSHWKVVVGRCQQEQGQGNSAWLLVCLDFKMCIS